MIAPEAYAEIAQVLVDAARRMESEGPEAEPAEEAKAQESAP